MSFSENFTFYQSSGTPDSINGVDLSTGTNIAITQRKVYLTPAEGGFLVPPGTTTNYILWNEPATTITIANLLSQDTALSIQVDWCDVSGGVLYSKTIAFGFDAFGQTFYYNLTQTQIPITNPAQVLATNYYYNKMVFRVLLDSAAQSILFASDIYSSQVCYDAEQNMINNSNNFF